VIFGRDDLGRPSAAMVDVIQFRQLLRLWAWRTI
jgi:hypothetical protein